MIGDLLTPPPTFRQTLREAVQFIWREIICKAKT